MHPDAGRPEARPPSFVVDCMLGRLALWLRAFGFDAWYQPFAEDRVIASLARETGRLLLTRDTGLRYVHGARTIFVLSDHVEEQLRQVVAEAPLDLAAARPLTRCTVCNRELCSAARSEVWDRIPPFVYLTQERYAECTQCRRVYWSGTHVDHMLARLAELAAPTPEGPAA
jgi:uncharacterized protein